MLSCSRTRQRTSAEASCWPRSAALGCCGRFELPAILSPWSPSCLAVITARFAQLSVLLSRVTLLPAWWNVMLWQRQSSGWGHPFTNLGCRVVWPHHRGSSDGYYRAPGESCQEELKMRRNTHIFPRFFFVLFRARLRGSIGVYATVLTLYDPIIHFSFMHSNFFFSKIVSDFYGFLNEL